MRTRVKRLLGAAFLLFAGCSWLSAQDTLSVASRTRAKMDSLRNVIAARRNATAAAENGSADRPAAGTVTVARGMLTAEELLLRADSLRLAYDFPAAVDCYQEALDKAADSLARQAVEEAMILGENGLSMMDYCSDPVVVAKQRFSVRDFFLYYPMRDRSWRAMPNQLDSLGSEFVRATYIPDGGNSLFWSAPDREGVRNIYQSHLIDTLWTAPKLINEQITSSSDEIYPVVSADGRSLYFASKGLYGMGGYDLYVSTYNRETQDWDTPVNLGFPFSSPYDDFLFYNTEDGKYSIFASNRECSRDSVYLYVLEYDGMPVRRKIADVARVRELSALPVRSRSRIDNRAISGQALSQSVDTRRYVDKMNEVRALKDSVSALTASAAADILTLLPAMQARLEKVTKELQAIEMEFLSRGVVIDPDKLRSETDREVVGAGSGYTFTRHAPGAAVALNMARPEPDFDYTFRILPEAQFAENNTLPSGLVYQIQLFSLSRKATVAQLKGLSPVFEKLSPSLRYTYSVGLFRSYNDVLSHLNSVKRLGFKSAVITAYRDGQSLSVSAARKLESQIRTLYKIRLFPEDGQSLPELVRTAIHQQTDKDIVRLMDNGSVVFEVGPVDSRQLAEQLVQVIKATGVQRVSIMEMGNTIVK